jgi:hypothetical protein
VQSRPKRAGAAAAVVETATDFGGELGIAVLGSIGIAATGPARPPRRALTRRRPH